MMKKDNKEGSQKKRMKMNQEEEDEDKMLTKI